jgi:hypothetical protein
VPIPVARPIAGPPLLLMLRVNVLLPAGGALASQFTVMTALFDPGAMTTVPEAAM